MNRLPVGYSLDCPFFPLFKISGLYVTRILMSVDRSKGMLGTFAPQREPYVHTLEEETTPSGVLARGLYTAKLKVKCLKLRICVSISIKYPNTLNHSAETLQMNTQMLICH